MTERPIIFSGPMVRAILSGAKTQTRRVVKPQPIDPLDDAGFDPVNLEWRWDHDNVRRCPYGVRGDRLYVKEKFACSDVYGHTAKLAYDADARCGYKTGGVFVPHGRILEASGYGWWASQPKACSDTYGLKGYGGRWKSSRFMPRWASRIALEVTGVRVERVQDISEADAIAEGITHHDGLGVGHSGFRYSTDSPVYDTAKAAYAVLWDTINAKRGHGWGVNPWAWVVEFERKEQA